MTEFITKAYILCSTYCGGASAAAPEVSQKLKKSAPGVLQTIALALLLPMAGLAQASTIRGVVVDDSGGVIVGAKITVVDALSKTVRELRTGDSGEFQVGGLNSGRYAAIVKHKALDENRVRFEVSTEEASPPLHIVMHVTAARQSVEVSAADSYLVPEARGATKIDTPVMETPVSVAVIPHEVLQDQQIVHLEDALENVSGVVPNNDSYGTNDSFTIRGFDQREATYEDGLRLDQYSTSGFPRDLANIDRIEVIKGPASMLYGQGEPGGVVNIVTKKPLEQSHYSLDQQAGSYGFYRTALDATGPLSGRLFYRFNLDYQNEGSFRDFIQTKEIALFPTLQWKPTDRTQATAEFTYEKGSLFLDNGIPFLPDGTPANVPIRSNYAEPGLNKEASDEWAIKVTASHQFSSRWNLRTAYKSQYVDSSSPNSFV